jgi:hypothetical protein
MWKAKQGGLRERSSHMTGPARTSTAARRGRRLLRSGAVRNSDHQATLVRPDSSERSRCDRSRDSPAKQPRASAVVHFVRDAYLASIDCDEGADARDSQGAGKLRRSRASSSRFTSVSLWFSELNTVLPRCTASTGDRAMPSTIPPVGDCITCTATARQFGLVAHRKLGQNVG